MPRKKTARMGCCTSNIQMWIPLAHFDLSALVLKHSTYYTIILLYYHYEMRLFSNVGDHSELSATSIEQMLTD